jgi:hypothetical protein
MKGKRKIKTMKWQMAEQFKAEARGVLTKRSSRASRFLNAALSAEGIVEPIGTLAGTRSSFLTKHDRLNASANLASQLL